MSELMKCGQKTCNAEATCRFFWPGNPPLPSCEPCKERALAAAKAMGFFLHVEPIERTG